MLLKPTRKNVWRCGPLRVQKEPRRHFKEGGSEPQVSIWRQQNARWEEVPPALERFEAWSAGQLTRSKLSKWSAAAIGLCGWGAISMSGTLGDVAQGAGSSRMALTLGLGLLALAVAVWRAAERREEQVEAAIGTMRSWREKHKPMIETAQERMEIESEIQKAPAPKRAASKRM